MVDDRNPVAQLLRFLEIMGREDDRDPGCVQFLEKGPKLLPKLDVYPRGGLVEHQDRGRMDHRLGNQQPPLHAARQGPGISIRLVGQPHRRQQGVGLPLGCPDAVEAGLDLQRLARGKEGVEQDFLRDHADRQFGVARMRVDVEAPDLRRPLGLGDEPGEDVDQGRLARPIGPEQPEELPPPDFKADPV